MHERVCKHLGDFNSLWPHCISFRCLPRDLYSVAFFPGWSTNLLTLEGFVWRKQAKIYLHIIAVWPVGVLDVATLSRQLSAGLLMKTHKHRKCGRNAATSRVVRAESCLIPCRFLRLCLNSAQCGLERSCVMWAWDFPRQIIKQPGGGGLTYYYSGINTANNINVVCWIIKTIRYFSDMHSHITSTCENCQSFNVINESVLQFSDSPAINYMWLFGIKKNVGEHVQ